MTTKTSRERLLTLIRDQLSRLDDYADPESDEADDARDLADAVLELADAGEAHAAAEHALLFVAWVAVACDQGERDAMRRVEQHLRGRRTPNRDRDREIRAAVAAIRADGTCAASAHETVAKQHGISASRVRSIARKKRGSGAGSRPPKPLE